MQRLFTPTRLLAWSAAAMALLALLVILLNHPLRIGFDQALYVTIGKLLLEGKTIYIDMVDNNPPLIGYLSTIPAAMASLFHIPSPLAFSLSVLLAIAYSTIASFVVLEKGEESSAGPLVLVASIPFHSLMLETIFSKAIFEFGQREHIFMLFYIPFFLLRWLRYRGRKTDPQLAAVTGTLAGIGICVKPHFLTLVLAVELFLLVGSWTFKHLLRVENYCWTATLMIYAAHFLFLPAAVRHAYFEVAIPTYIYGYEYFERPTIYLLNYEMTQSQYLFYLMAGCAIASFLLADLSAVVAPACVMMLGSMFIYFMQSKGWPYHLIPLSVSTYLLRNLLVVLLLQRLGGIAFGAIERLGIDRFVKRWPRAGKVAATGLCTLIFAIVSIYPVGLCLEDHFRVQGEPQFDMKEIGFSGKTTEYDLAYLSDYIREHTRPGDQVVVVADNTEPGCTLLLQLERRQGSRHMDMARLCPFQFIRDVHPQAWNDRFAVYREEYVGQIIEDIKTRKPVMVILQKGRTEGWMNEFNFRGRALKLYKQVADAGDYWIFVRHGKKNSRHPEP